MHNHWSWALWLTTLFMQSGQYVVTKKLVQLYNYPTATAWYYIATAFYVLGGILLTHDFSADVSLLPVSWFQVKCLLFKVYASSLFVYLASSYVMQEVPLLIISTVSGVSALLAMLLTDTDTTPWELVGTALMTAGMIFAAKVDIKASEPKEPKEPKQEEKPVWQATRDTPATSRLMSPSVAKGEQTPAGRTPGRRKSSVMAGLDAIKFIQNLKKKRKQTLAVALHVLGQDYLDELRCEIEEESTLVLRHMSMRI